MMTLTSDTMAAFAETYADVHARIRDVSEDMQKRNPDEFDYSGHYDMWPPTMTQWSLYNGGFRVHGRAYMGGGEYDTWSRHVTMDEFLNWEKTND